MTSKVSSASALGTYYALHIGIFFFSKYATITRIGGTSDGQCHKSQQKKKKPPKKSEIIQLMFTSDNKHGQKLILTLHIKGEVLK